MNELTENDLEELRSVYLEITKGTLDAGTGERRMLSTVAKIVNNHVNNTQMFDEMSTAGLVKKSSEMVNAQKETIRRIVDLCKDKHEVRTDDVMHILGWPADE